MDYSELSTKTLASMIYASGWRNVLPIADVVFVEKTESEFGDEFCYKAISWGDAIHVYVIGLDGDYAIEM